MSLIMLGWVLDKGILREIMRTLNEHESEPHYKEYDYST